MDREYQLWLSGFTDDYQSTGYSTCLSVFPHTIIGRSAGLALLRKFKASEFKNLPADIKRIVLSLEGSHKNRETHECDGISLVDYRWLTIV